ncbi:MAG: cytidylate kinase family protein [Clostridia bacterium]|nr:cytidylate kinase family protein [Clostridia bacterium]
MSEQKLTTNKISLAGDLGSGKSTVSEILIKRLNAEYYSTGVICRRFAAEHGFSVIEMNTYMETHPEFDKVIDDGLVALSDVDKAMVIDSRMAWHFVKDTFRVYMTTELQESARRILSAKRAEEKAQSIEECARNIKTRKASETKRYREKYGVNCKDLSNYSLVVDSTYASPEDVAACILSCFADWQEDHSRRYAYICPRRFLYSDDAADMARVSKLSAWLDEGEDIGTVTAVEYDGDIYITENAEIALAYELSLVPLVPTVLSVVDKKPSGTFVSMKDSLF